MNYLGLYASQNIDKCFEKYGVSSLLRFTPRDKIMLRIGYQYIESVFIFRILAIQMDNSATYETFEVFDMDFCQATSEEEIVNIAYDIAEKIIGYNKDILRYYMKR